MTSTCLSPLGVSSSADDRAKGLKLATICRCLSRVLTCSNARWTLRSRRQQKERMQPAEPNVPQRTLEACSRLAIEMTGEHLRDYKAPLKKAAMTEATATV